MMETSMPSNKELLYLLRGRFLGLAEAIGTSASNRRSLLSAGAEAVALRVT